MKKPYVYLVLSPESESNKVGISEDYSVKLYHRYCRYFGPKTIVYAFERESKAEARALEKEFQETFATHPRRKGRELFCKTYFQEYFDYLGEKTGITPRVLTIENESHDKYTALVEQTRKNPIGVTHVNNRLRDESLDLFCIVTSPDVEVVSFTVRNQQSYRSISYICRQYATYYGEDSEMYFIKLPYEAKQFGEDIQQSFKNHEICNCLFTKDRLNDYVQYVLGNTTNPLMYMKLTRNDAESEVVRCACG